MIDYYIIDRTNICINLSWLQVVPEFDALAESCGVCSLFYLALANGKNSPYREDTPKDGHKNLVAAIGTILKERGIVDKNYADLNKILSNSKYIAAVKKWKEPGFDYNTDDIVWYAKRKKLAEANETFSNAVISEDNIEYIEKLNKLITQLNSEMPALEQAAMLVRGKPGKKQTETDVKMRLENIKID